VDSSLQNFREVEGDLKDQAGFPLYPVFLFLSFVLVFSHSLSRVAMNCSVLLSLCSTCSLIFLGRLSSYATLPRFVSRSRRSASTTLAR
jgi:hypothetical protein